MRINIELKQTNKTNTKHIYIYQRFTCNFILCCCKVVIYFCNIYTRPNIIYILYITTMILNFVDSINFFFYNFKK